MKKSLIRRSIVPLFAVLLLLMSTSVRAAEVKVMVSGGFQAAMKVLAPEFERMTGDKVTLIFGPGIGAGPDTIPNRLKRGESADLFVMVGFALDGLIKEGKAVPDSRVDLAESPIGAAVRAGTEKPDISTVEKFKHAMLSVKSFGYSDAASGIYVSTALFRNLGIEKDVMPKGKLITTGFVGDAVARGDVELGFQQMSELLPIKGIDIVGPLPPEIQKITLYSGAIAAGAKEPEEAKKLLKFLTSAQALPVIKNSGLDPVTPGKK
jgi:molybdate transport system substrate-binding protein